MAPFFEPKREEIEALDRLTDDIPEIHQVLVRNHDQLKIPDRAAHQQQILGGRVALSVEKDLPPELRDLGLFQSSGAAPRIYMGIGRVSTGMGCPHLEIDLDFLEIMLAFRTGGRRIDFIGLNDPAAPTNNARDFLALLRATADSAGTEVPFGSVGELHLGNLAFAQIALAKTLVERAGVGHGLGIFDHVANQTKRTVLSSSAVQQYWTGVIRANDTLGKFTLGPEKDVNELRSLSPGASYLSEDCEKRQSASDLEFRLYWIAFRDPKETPLDELAKAWREEHRSRLGRWSFPKSIPRRKRRGCSRCSQRKWAPLPAIGWRKEQNPSHPSSRQPSSPREDFWPISRVRRGATRFRKIGMNPFSRPVKSKRISRRS